MSQIAVCNRRVPHLALVLAVAMLAVIACTLALAPAARAGKWAQLLCTAGEPATYEGWVFQSLGSYSPSGNLKRYNTCLLSGGAVTAYDETGPNQARGSGPMWIYYAPQGSTIAGGWVSYSLLTPNGVAYLATPHNLDIPADELAGCEAPSCSASAENGVASITHTGGTALYVAALCIPLGGESLCRSSGAANAEANIYSAEIVLENTATPTGSEFAGTLLHNPVSGTANLGFTAHDMYGPGVYRVTITVDGKPAYSATPDPNGGKCKVLRTNSEGVREFPYLQPCPQEESVLAEVPTAEIADGQHQLEVEVEDAAGNTAVVYEHAITIANDPAAALGVTAPGASAPVRGPTNGTPASENAILTAQWAGKSGKSGKESARRLTSAYGRSHEVAGKLTTTAGVPIAGALIEVSQKPSSLGAMASSLASTHTGTDGSFMIHVPSDASSSIQLAFRSHLGDAQPAATQTLTLQVPASIHLAVSPHVTSVGRTIVLSGKLAGPIPPGGKQVLFEAHAVGSGGSWIEFHNATVDAHGHFRATHRFTFPGPARYQFRVVCMREADFPFLTGISNVVHVRER
jgi:hypothetical protein